MPAIIGKGRASMNWDVVEVKPEPEWVLFVCFADGLAGRVRFQPSCFHGVFAPLRDPAAFRRVYIDHGAVAWPGDVDLAPDAMYREIRANGEWLLDSAVRDSVA
jgi:hypothetical protein